MRYIASVISLAFVLIGAVRMTAVAPACAIITPAPVYSSVNIRTAPAIADNIAGQLLRGQVAIVDGVEGDWYRLTGGNPAGRDYRYIKSTVVVCVIDPTPTRIPSSTPTDIPTVPPTSTPAPISTPTMFRVCIQDICSLFSSPIVVTIDEYRP